MLTSLMDVFTLLLFFLMVNGSGSNPLQSPPGLEAPVSIAEEAPKEGVMVVIATKTEITVDSNAVATVQSVLSRKAIEIPELVSALKKLREKDTGGLVAAEDEEDIKNELVILADRTHSYEFVRKILISGRKAGFTKLTFAAVGK